MKGRPIFVREGPGPHRPISRDSLFTYDNFDDQMPDLRPFEELSADHLRLILQTGHIGIWELDVSSGLALRNAHHDAIFGYDERLDEWTYDKFIEHVVPEQRQLVHDLQQAAIEKGDVWSFDCAIRKNDGELRWISASGRPLMGPDGKVAKLIGHVIDITDTKQRESRLTLLTEELNHRVRNMLAVIKSIVRLSSRKADDIAGFAKSLEGRVEALARSHRLMVSDASETLTSRAILEAELAAFPSLENRVEIEVGGDKELSGAAGQGLALVFHELVTNALKYGALSNSDGRVFVSISANEDALDVAWREEGGPKVEAVHEDGFGSRLIADAIGSTGRVDLRFPAAGVECDICLHTPV